MNSIYHSSSGVAQSDNTFTVTERDCSNSIENVEPEDMDVDNTDVLLCVLFKNNKLAAAYYKIGEKMLYLFYDIVDLQPEYLALRSLIREVQPSHVITIGGLCDDFIKCLIGLLGGDDTRTMNTTVDSKQLPKVPSNLSLLPQQEFSSTNCEFMVKSLHLLSESPDLSTEEHEFYLHSLIDFRRRLTIHALGALIKFLERSWANLRITEDQLFYYHIKQVSLYDQVYIDCNTFKSLQVFKSMAHDSNFKHGQMSTTREGLSLFRLFAQHCKSKVGYMSLRNLMLRPTKDLNELTRRLDFISFTLDKNNQQLIQSLQECIKSVFDINLVLTKIRNSKAKATDWCLLHTTIYNVLLVKEFCTPYGQQCQIFSELADSVTDNLYALQRCISDAIDFKKLKGHTRPVIKIGLDEELDQVKTIRENMDKHVKSAAVILVDQLPEHLKECTVFYIPDMGYVVSIPKWSPDCNYNELQECGFQYLFELNNNFHYKNAICQELDRQLGNIESEILNHEYRIIKRMGSFVMRYNDLIHQPLEIVGRIDCLIAMAKAASQNGYVRPELNQENVHEIVGGHHPILELENPNYVCNDFYSGGSHSHVKIITGPNSSGKTIYLKQIALLVYLAHLGSFIPAERANISMVHSMHSRLQSTESVVMDLSAFMIDLTQMSQALHNAMPSSLILMDEFGRGTTGEEGLALLTGALKRFLKQDRYCPHVLVSTHLQIPQHLLNSPLIEYQQMEHMAEDNTSDIVFLYKIVPGISTSFGLEVAASAELDPEIVARVADMLRNDEEVRRVERLVDRRFNVTDVDIKFLTDLETPNIF